jgi:hypothetical protein
MVYYINSVASSDALGDDIRELIPVPELRRRMSRVVRMAVATGIEALAVLPAGVQPDAIITATRLGCLADSEKFLRAVVDDDGGLLNPTPFIQSTFNTVGAQIAMLTANRCYNMTYADGEHSLAAALVDAAIQLDRAGAAHVLVGLFDEVTPTLQKIGERMRGVPGLPLRDGARFFVVSTGRLDGCVAVVDALNEQNLSRWL